MESAWQRVDCELERFDLLIRREVMRSRARHQLSLDEFRGLYVSDEQVDELLRKPEHSFDAREITARAESIRLRHEAARGGSPEWKRIVAEFSLTSVEQDLLFLALAPELDPKYETLYAYLNNDVRLRFGTADLARRLLSERGPTAVDHALARGSTLFRTGLLAGPPASSGFQASAVLCEFVLAKDAPPMPPLRRIAPEKRTSAAPADARSDKRTSAAALLQSRAVLILTGNRGAGRRDAAMALSRQAGMGLLSLDAEEVKADGESSAMLAASVALQARLEGAALYVGNGDAWFDVESRPHSGAARFVRGLEDVPLCLAFSPHANWRELIGHRRALEVVFPALSQADRLAEWNRAASEMAIDAPADAIGELAQRFVFTRGEIASAAQNAKDALSVEPAQARDALFAAARAQSARHLGKLASKVSTSYRWSDLVLPPTTATQVREVAAAIRDRGFVYGEWRMSRGSCSAGLNVLFSGASGTGKTMSAGIVAAESGLDLYAINLSVIVSKYIGETEKHLERIFTAARSSNAILFFDEADALFGKRSDVRDAHDRYANVEVAYLLQKLEEHDGVVILASNLPRNMDAAFTRRIQFQVEFPLPGEADRERLWRGMFPAPVPLAADVDFKFLARQFQLTGGQIRTVSVDAAFFAAGDGRQITMPLLIRAVARHFLRQGQIPTINDFREYFPIATETSRPVEGSLPGRR